MRSDAGSLTARLEAAQRAYPLAAVTGVAIDDQGAVTVVDLHSASSRRGRPCTRTGRAGARRP